MRCKLGLFGFAVVLFIAAAVLLVSPAFAKHSNFTSRDLRGAYIGQCSGTMDFPSPPLSYMNGPFVMTARIVADGQGNLSGSGVEVHNGQAVALPFTGTYTVEDDGTIWITLTGTTPGLGSLSIKVYGFLFDEGKQVKLIYAGVMIPGFELPPGFVGITAAGSWIRQDGE